MMNVGRACRIVVLCVFWAFLALSRPGMARDLPDFADLAERSGMAVVNISTTQAIKQGRSGIPSLDEDDPMFDFRRRKSALFSLSTARKSPSVVEPL